MTVKVELTNLTEIRRDLERLESDLQKKALRSGVRSISTAVKNEAVKRSPADTSKLRRNITARFWRARDKKQQSYAIRVRTRGKRDDENNAFYWRFVDEGHAVRGSGSRTRPQRAAFSGKRVPGEEFFSATFDWLRSNIDGLVSRHMRRAIDRTVKAASRKRARSS